MSTDLAGALEAQLIATAQQWTCPHERECLLCYVARMLSAFGCDNTLRWARRWRDLRLPRATGLEKRLGQRGGFCDCEIFLNGWNLAAVSVKQGGCEQDSAEDSGAELPDCAGVSPRSSQPCSHWVPLRRAW